MQLAFVLTNTPGLPDAKAIAAAYSEVAPSGSGPIVWEGGGGHPDQHALSIGGTLVVVAAMPSPVPDREADEAVRRSLSALGTGWALPEHRFHIIVAATGVDESTAVAERCDFTRAVAAVSRAASSVGVYWGAAAATHEASFFFETARDAELPIALWTGVSVASDGDERVSLLSFGMGQFGLDELLLTGPVADAEVAIEMFFDLLSYAVERGATVGEGETVGRSDGERIRVAVEASPVDPERRVWRVDLPD
jgi:hypothetical protein